MHNNDGFDKLFDKIKIQLKRFIHLHKKINFKGNYQNKCASFL